MLHPNDKLVKVWTVILASLLCYTAIVMPWRMAFIDSYLWDDWFIAELVIDGLFLVDVICNCMSAFWDYEGNLVTSRKEIILNYARGWMILDLVA